MVYVKVFVIFFFIHGREIWYIYIFIYREAIRYIIILRHTHACIRTRKRRHLPLPAHTHLPTFLAVDALAKVTVLEDIVSTLLQA